MKIVRGMMNADIERTSDALRKAAAEQGHTLAEGESDAPATLVFKKGATPISWGSQLNATLGPDGPRTRITLTPGETFAITDWGRRRRAATKLLDALGATDSGS